MKKYISGIVLLMTSIIFGGCGRETGDGYLCDAGVSQELAQLRKREIKDLKYNLSFAIPEEKDAAVRGEATVSFTLDEVQDVILDYREGGDSILAVSANGAQAAYEFRNEHIILPKSQMQAGHNEVSISFVAGDQSLNRNDEFLYTLLVPDRARTLFPCFEQPNLKASFTLTLEVPAGWTAVSNTRITSEEPLPVRDRRRVAFAPTEPLSTYLFSFVAGKLQHREYRDGDRLITAYYRETEPRKVAQLDTIFKQIASAIRWQEEYTQVPYPFSKYDFIILPGFQYGGMEHVGAALYNDTQMFLSEHPTPDEVLARTKLIAHEVSHAWFGDLVTMDWFNDVWTKEVFANYFAACVTEPLFPDINHRLNWLKTYTAGALAEDRTEGTTPIRQQLDNLQNGGLIYGNIIYYKAPVMMQKLAELMGEDKLREGLREYLRTYAYGNATWDDLIRILDSRTDEDLAAFSDVWVNQKGMPEIRFELKGNQLTVRQRDPLGRGLLWPQRFDVTVCGEQCDTTVEVNMRDSVCMVSLPFRPTRILPNTDGRAYGLLVPDRRSMQWLLANWETVKDETARQALLMVLHENYQARNISDADWMKALLGGLPEERNALIASTVCGYLSMPLQGLSPQEREVVEATLCILSERHALPSCRTQLTRLLITGAYSPATVQKIYKIWQAQSNKSLSENDYMTMSYELALRLPEQGGQILATQRQRIQNPDRLRQFDFISRAITTDTLRLDSLFHSLLEPENRRIEPWTATTLAYLNHPTRSQYAVKYIRPALEALEGVQRTGDIFFPRNWVSALLRNHRSAEAYRAVADFLAAHPDYPPLLRNKVLQAAHSLHRLHAARR